MSDKKMTKKKDYIDKPAGVGDSIEFNAIQMNQIFKGDEDKATNKNAETSATKPIKRDVVYSNQLKEGMSIPVPVANGGKPKSRDGESR